MFIVVRANRQWTPRIKLALLLRRQSRNADTAAAATVPRTADTMAQKPGHVFCGDELARKLNLPQFTPRRAEALVAGINDVLGEDTVTEMSRRGWDAHSVREHPDHAQPVASVATGSSPRTR